jgi:hypothetical protein
VSGTKINIQRASAETHKLIEDLQDRVNRLERARTSSEDGGEVRISPDPPPLRKVLWVDDRPDANVFERARVIEAGYSA